MTTELTDAQWRDIGKRLAEPFNPQDVDYRPQGKPGPSGKVQAVCFIDARTVQERLDAVVGPGAWSFDWTPLVVEKGDVQVAKGTLTIHGVSKSDAGSASNFEATLGAVSHCFKRAAVHWGIGRYLYGLPMTWVTPEGNGQRLSDATVRELRSKLPRPDGRPSAQATQQVTADASASEPLATEQQLTSIRKLCEALHTQEPAPGLTYQAARDMVTRLAGQYQRATRSHATETTTTATTTTRAAAVTPDEPPATAPASLKVSDMDTFLATVASGQEQFELVKAIKEKGFKSRTQVSGFVSAHVTRDLEHDLDIEALGKFTSDITHGELRALLQALETIRAPRQPAQAKPAATPAHA